MSLSRKVKTALDLDENRLLILGAQVLFGFQLQAIFQDIFAQISEFARGIDCLALMLMALAIGLLIAPSMRHRIVASGADTNEVHRAAGLFASAALVPLGTSLGLDVYLVFDHVFGPSVAVMVGGSFFGLAGLLWFVAGLVARLALKVPSMAEKEEPTPPATRIDQMLTEARVIVPGAQALLGFQLVVTFTRAFGDLAATPKLVHMAALCCIALAIILLTTPAALHRIAFRGEDTDAFLAIGSGFVLAAPAALAVGLAGDMHVAIGKATDSSELATGLAVASAIVLFVLWYGLPFLLRVKRAESGQIGISSGR
jgi:hypothetical protein